MAPESTYLSSIILFWFEKYAFLQRDAMLVRYMLSSCLRLSIRLSQPSTLPKTLNIGSHKLHSTIAQGL